MSNANKLARYALAIRHSNPSLSVAMWALAKAQVAAAYQQEQRQC